ncbi:polysaccharide biosynthesis tyrosine autokinase, partial [Sphingomonas sp.]|uniref:GumC family protein n=1 Tax=Sphingomonas sp. TaxID=28214 RepID=UPI0025E6C585
MNNSIAVPSQGPWPLGHYVPEQTVHLRPGQRTYSAAYRLDFPALVRIVQHWRWLILGALAIGVAGAIIITLLTAPVYRASVTLEANPPTVEVSDEQTRESHDTSEDAYGFIVTQVGLLSSETVAQRTAQELNLGNNPAFVPQTGDASTRLKIAARRVRGGLKVVPPQEGNLISFSFDSTSPQLAAMVANGIADSFINSTLQRRYEASAYARNFLERQIGKTRGDLEASERSLVAYAQREGIINTAGSANGDKNGSGSSDAGSLQGDTLVALNSALATATARRVAAEGAYEGALNTGPTSDVTAAGQVLRQQRASIAAEYQQKRTFLKPDHPDMLSLKAQMDELDRQIASESSQVSSGRNNSLLQDYRAALAAERSLQARVAGLKGDVLNLRGRSIQYNILQREVDTNRTLYDALLQRYKEIGVAGGVGTAPVSVVDHADTPGSPFKPNLMLNLLYGIGAGLLAGLGGAIGLEFLNDTVKTREDVRSKLGLACFGAVPKTGANESFVDALRNPASVVSEAYSAIVTALRFSTETGTPKTLLVTSSQPGEGKSSTALALSQNFARRGKSVLLVDSDLRKPAFRSASDAIGLTKLLTNDEKLIQHITETQHENLWLLASGPVPPNPADLLSTGRIRTILKEAAERFDIVIIDAPPTLGLADSPLLAAAAGHVMFVVQSGQTRTRAAIEALNRIEATGANVLGVTLTKITDSVGGYG